jgi:hypothetical protein
MLVVGDEKSGTEWSRLAPVCLALGRSGADCIPAVDSLLGERVVVFNARDENMGSERGGRRRCASTR